jgi:hypothetical protein
MISLILIDVQQLDSVTSMVNDCPIGYDGKDCELCANGFVEKRNAHENRKCIACVANGPLAIVGAIFGFIIIAGFIYDGNIQRGSELHRFMLGMSVGGVFLYVIGIPLLLIVMTSRRCWRGATWQQRQSATGSLLECYKEKYW